jgi:DNA polymerase lambda
VSAGFLKDTTAYVLPSGIGKARLELFKANLIKNGATLINENQELALSPTSNKSLIILFDTTIIDTWTSLEKALIAKKKLYPSLKQAILNRKETIRFVSTSWLSECLKINCLIDTADFEIQPVEQGIKRPAENEPTCSGFGKKAKISSLKQTARSLVASTDFDISSSESVDDFDVEPELDAQVANSKINTETWTCAHSSAEQAVNVNKHITDKLEEMSKVYENQAREKFKAVAYQKAIVGLKRCSQAIRSYEVIDKSCLISLCVYKVGLF